MYFIHFNTHIVFLLICNVFLIRINAKDLQNDITTSSTPTSTLQRSIPEGYITKADGLTKRDVKITDVSSANTIGLAAKSYDPPPELYRGPGSTGHQTPSYYNNNNNYKPLNGFISRPLAFPDTHSSNNNNNHNKYSGAGGDGEEQDSSDTHLANSYNSWQHLKEKVGGLLNKKGALQDRISVGHYGTTEHHGGSTSGGYAYESRPYGGGQAHHVEYIPSNTHYASSAAPSGHTSGYYGGSAAGEGIPFDVYGSKNHYSSLGGSDYASYSFPETHEPAAHKGHPDISKKALLAKSFLIPLASAAVLGIAAALVSNPLLLQLGTVSGAASAFLGKRKRRDLTTSATPNNRSTNSFSLASTSVKRNKKDTTTVLPYRGHHQQSLKKHHHRHFVRT